MAPIVAWMCVVIAVMAPNGEAEQPPEEAPDLRRGRTLFAAPAAHNHHVSRPAPAMLVVTVITGISLGCGHECR